jgi:hypothetical protein
MEELTVMILKILGALVLFRQLINKLSWKPEPDEVRRVLGRSFALRTGNLSPWQEE